MMIEILRSLFHRNPTAISAVEAQAATAKRSSAAEPAVLLDVREDHEWKAGHAPGAVHIPLGQLPARLTTLPRDRQIITVCRSGRRSALAAQQLERRGYTTVNLRGGMTAWAAADLPVITTGPSSTGRIV